MWDIWILQNPASKLTKQLVIKCYNIYNQQLLSQLESDEGTTRMSQQGGARTTAGRPEPLFKMTKTKSRITLRRRWPRTC